MHNVNKLNFALEKSRTDKKGTLEGLAYRLSSISSKFPQREFVFTAASKIKTEVALVKRKKS